MTEFTDIFSKETQDSIVHYGCLGLTTGVGMAVGSAAGAGPVGTIAGGAAGLAWGKTICPKLREPIRKKLFDPLATLTPAESAETFDAFGKHLGSRKSGVHMASLIKGGHLKSASAKA